jgi:hypothetical protein
MLSPGLRGDEALAHSIEEPAPPLRLHRLIWWLTASWVTNSSAPREALMARGGLEGLRCIEGRLPAHTS